MSIPATSIEKANPVLNSHQLALRGMLLAFFGYIFFSCQDVLMAINTQFYSALQLTWINCLTVLTTLVVVLIARKGWRGLKVVLHTDHLKTHLLRGAMVAIGTGLVFIAIRDVPLPNFYAIIFIGPILAVSLSSVFLKEHVTFLKIVVLLIGFAGLLISLNPGSEGFNMHSIYVVIAACFFGSSALMGRFLSRKDTALSLMFYPVLMAVIFFTVPVIIGFKSIALVHLPQVMITGGFTTIAFFLTSHAYKMAPIYLIVPCQFLQFFWGSIAHAVMNNALPERSVAIGAMLIILSNLFIIGLQLRQKHNEQKQEAL